jgi:hypothetical protein
VLAAQVRVARSRLGGQPDPANRVYSAAMRVEEWTVATLIVLFAILGAIVTRRRHTARMRRQAPEGWYRSDPADTVTDDHGEVQAVIVRDRAGTPTRIDVTNIDVRTIDDPTFHELYDAVFNAADAFEAWRVSGSKDAKEGERLSDLYNDAVAQLTAWHRRQPPPQP